MKYIACILTLVMALGTLRAQEHDGAITPSELADRTWRLVALQEERDLPLEAGAVVTLTLSAQGQASGMAAINRYFGQASFAKESRIAWEGPLGSTKMAGPEALMALEAAYLRLLTETTRYHLIEGRLVLENEEGTVRLVYEEEVVR